MVSSFGICSTIDFFIMVCFSSFCLIKHDGYLVQKFMFLFVVLIGVKETVSITN